jgi:hypothetical protein
MDRRDRGILVKRGLRGNEASACTAGEFQDNRPARAETIDEEWDSRPFPAKEDPPSRSVDRVGSAVP